MRGVSLAGLMFLLAVTGAETAPVPRYGVNQDFVWTRDEQVPRLIEAMHDAQVQAVRIEIRWNTVEAERGKWDFTRLDRVVQALRAAKIEILADLMSVPPWASGVKPAEVKGFYDSFPPQHMEDWEQFVRKVAGRYRKDIRFWEIWNEENGCDFYRPLPNAAQYVGLLKSAHDTIKSVVPKATVVLRGMQFNGIIANPWLPVKTTNYLQQVYDAGGRRFFDVVNIHPYVLPTPNEGPAYAGRLVRDTIRVMEKNRDGRKPLWITETGLATGGDVTEEMQAEHLAGMYRELGKIPQVKAIYWFLLQDLDQAVCGGENTMGLITTNGLRKPAFEAFKRVIRRAKE